MFFRRLSIHPHPDSFWFRIASISLIIFFVTLGDSILSYWVPTFIQESLKSAFVMGLIMGFSSLVGLGADFILPQILKGMTVKRLMTRAIIASITCSLLLLAAIKMPVLILLLGAMAAWGIYYELIAFSNHQLIATYVPKYGHASAWGWIMMFKNIAYIIGPVLAGLIAQFFGEQKTFAVLGLGVTLVSAFLLLTTPKKLKLLQAEIKEWE